MPVTLVVETGAASATANSFVDVATFKQYCDDHGYDYATPAWSDSLISQALITAGEYLRNEDRYPWRGQRVADTQRMPWPRSGAVLLYGTGNTYPSNVIPSAVQDAQSEIAFRTLNATAGTNALVGNPQPDLEHGGNITSVNAGGVSVSFGPGAQSIYTLVKETLIYVAQGILKPFLRRQVDLPKSPFSSLDQRGYVDSSSPVNGTGAPNSGVDYRPSSADIPDSSILP